ncbi:universal stress protein [Mycolicibacterium holsaticum]|jgi:nucleotide-binding universal stress UspA family protein|uniref:universal stress protein n=1 Tax=Mycolicibacterium holsaticum TaxID=152142 RepID=UPI001C7CD370|nr:universal stress protein [Mycolicibacterium holsaticum]MDA4105972.1 universal stress protein [Mycolicibacterium holsaticum DSM 44478 = JCM 12374]QZA13689.1 universal stress protein [Mycolicibacterium holsaticum DSM 44478 = JCM 12374]UNC08848.1 universal stress protein [Mycolicibacterium holsaticum DSM 44478 = JCM 12374]
MSESITKYGILVAVDGSPESEAAVRWAAREAAMHGRQVTLMHVIAPVEVTWPVTYLQSSFDEWQEENGAQVIEQARKTFQESVGAADAPAVHTTVEHGPIASTLVTATADAWMVVAGTRGMGVIGRALLGSISNGLLHYAHCPVAIVPTDEAQNPDPAAPVLLGIDGSPASDGATSLAFDEASRRGVELIALHAWSDNRVFPLVGVDWQKYEEEGHEVLAERLAGWQEQYPDVRVKRRLVADQPAHWLLDESSQAQLVVVGSRGRGGFKGMLLGSVATKVAQGAKAPVIVVRES